MRNTYIHIHNICIILIILQYNNIKLIISSTILHYARKKDNDKGKTKNTNNINYYSKYYIVLRIVKMQNT